MVDCSDSGGVLAVRTSAVADFIGEGWREQVRAVRKSSVKLQAQGIVEGRSGDGEFCAGEKDLTAAVRSQEEERRQGLAI